MIIVPDLTKVLCLGKYCVRYSYIILLIIPIVFLLIWLIRKTFVKFITKDEQEYYDKERKNLRIILLILRIILFTFLIFAIASPFITENRLIKGNPRLTILTDNSNSFELFDKTIGDQLYSNIKGKVPVNIQSIAEDEESAIGNGLLNNLEGGENILVITDGNSNRGKLLGDVLLFASSINSTVSTIDLTPKNNDLAIMIQGPYEVIQDTDATFFIKVNNAGEELSYTIEVTLDNEVIYSKSHSGSIEFPVSKFFSDGGFHKLTAQVKNINNQDHFPLNNIYYKTIKVVERPNVLFVTKKNSPLEPEFDRLYKVTKTSSIPNDLSQYLAVILNDIHATDILPKIDMLNDYVSEKGNGLVVIGGENSYDRGSYKQAKLLEPMLPVRIGAGEELEKSDVQIVIIVDVSGSSQIVYGTGGQILEVRDHDRVIKALASSVLDNIDEKHNIGVVAVGLYDPPHVGVVSEIKTLKNNKDELLDKISRLKGGGQSVIEQGITKATTMLQKKGGGKNIILISDGRGLSQTPMENTKNAVKQSSTRAIKTYVVGVGTKDSQETEFLSDIASIGRGIYFPTDASRRINVLFGEPDKEEEDFYNTVNVLDSVHFITSDLELDAVINGYNYIVPKSSARLLVSTNKNIPILAVWRYGLGRIVSLGTDDGSKWGADLLNKQNSQVITRSINWAIGNLGRKKSFDVKILDTTVEAPTYVSVISNDVPKHDQLFFIKTDINSYMAEFNPDEPSFYNFLGADVAVNYHIEYQNLGVNQQFINLINATGGKIFNKDDTDNIIEFVIEKSRRIKIDSTNIAWPFVIIVLIIFLIDIFIRRLWENKLIR